MKIVLIFIIKGIIFWIILSFLIFILTAILLAVGGTKVYRFNYPNGQIKYRGYLKRCRDLVGLEKKYHENGNIKSKIRWKKNEMKSALFYYENGNLESRIPFEDDEPLGIAEAYHENGNLKSKYYIDRLHMEYICCWCEDGKENKMLNLYNEKIKEIKEMYRKF